MEKYEKNPTANIYQYDAQLGLSFQADCEELLHEFSTKQSFAFNVFATLWKDKKFIAIFEKQTHMIVLKNFIENSFFIAKKFLFSMDFYKQTGALYLMYSLYYKQPIKKWVAIRMTQTEADKLTQMVQIHKLSGIHHPVFIFHKLILDGAFEFCALVQPLGLEHKYLRRYDLSNEEIYKRSPYECPFRKFKQLSYEDAALENLKRTDDEYQSLLAKYKQKTTRLASFPTTDLQQMFRKNCDDVSNLPLEDEEPDKSQKAKKKVIKKAVCSKNAVYRAEKAVMMHSELSASDFSDTEL